MNQYTYQKRRYQTILKLINAKFGSLYTALKEEKSIKSLFLFMGYILVLPLLYIISPLQFLYNITTDNEYSKNYLEYTIEENNYTNEEATNFLNEKYSEFQKRLLDGLLTYSEPKIQLINSSFIYLLNQHSEIIPTSNESDNKLVHTKQQTESKLEYNSLNSSLDNKQIILLIQCINELRILESGISEELINSIFSCEIIEPIRIGRNKNKLLIYLLSELSYKNYIDSEWQAICANNNLFMSFGGIVLTQNNYSSTLYDVKENPPKDSNTIDKYLKLLKEH